MLRFLGVGLWAALAKLRARCARPRPGSPAARRRRSRGWGGVRGDLSCPAGTGEGRLERLGSQQFAEPRAGRLGRGAEDREGSPRLRSPRSNPFGFCFGFARAAGALTCSNPFCGRGRPGLFKALSAPAPWAFLKRPDRSRAELAGAGLRGVLPSRQRYGVAGSSGFPSERRAPGNARDAATEAEPGRGAGRRRRRRGPPAGWEVHVDGGVHLRFPR